MKQEKVKTQKLYFVLLAVILLFIGVFIFVWFVGGEKLDFFGVQDESVIKQYNISIPEFDGKAFVYINDNTPFFETSEKTTEAFESYGSLDMLGRCTAAYANICKELMPTEKRESISHIKPTGWRQNKYEGIVDSEPPFLYNRCHLIAFCLAGESANENNLITGTRYLNVDGMLEFEESVARYVDKTGNHVLYRVTPDFRDDELLARGVLIEAYSVEDDGAGICFCVYCYNVQPGIAIDYKTGENHKNP